MSQITETVFFDNISCHKCKHKTTCDLWISAEKMANGFCEIVENTNLPVSGLSGAILRHWGKILANICKRNGKYRESIGKKDKQGGNKGGSDN